jgi:hypothetical protein
LYFVANEIDRGRMDSLKQRPNPATDVCRDCRDIRTARETSLAAILPLPCKESQRG